jgi:hypothetical protein
VGDSIIVHGHPVGKKATTIALKINKNDSNPATRVSYIEDIENAAPVSWSTISGAGVVASTDSILQKIKKVCNFRTCHVANGAVYKYLKPDDWRYYEDGTSAVANMTSATYDTMTEFPHFYMSITEDSSYVYLRISSRKLDDTYTDWMFSYNGTVRAKKYIGSFLGYNNGSKLYSRANVAPTVSLTMTNFRDYARARGTGYDMWDIQSLVILEILYLFAFRSTDSQTSVCPGYTSASALANTGFNYSSAYGDFYRSDPTSGTSRFRIFGIEDVWGNLYEYISNIFTVGTTLYLTDYNTGDQAGNTLATKTFSANYGGWVQTMMAEKFFPFVAKEGGVSGSSTTYYCDDGNVCSGFVARSGGRWDIGADAGIFRFGVYSSPGGDSDCGSRLVFSVSEVYSEAA